jgi:DNA-binding response OmpR family regulator
MRIEGPFGQEHAKSLRIRLFFSEECVALLCGLSLALPGTHPQTFNGIHMSALIILVNADPRALRHLEALLSEAGYLVAAMESFLEAKDLLESVTPDLLIADIRLQRFNGLQLAIRSHFDHPDVPVIVTHAREDAVVEAEARRYGVSFIAAPLENPNFLRCVESLVATRRLAQRPIRRWLRKSVPGFVEVNAAAARAHVIDMSYGGMRLAFDGPREIPTTFDITLPLGPTVQANRVWTRTYADDQFCCGAEVVKTAENDWRRFVDTLRGTAAH